MLIRLTTEEFLGRYHDESLMRFCKGCPHFAKNHACPPLPNGTTPYRLMSVYPYAHILGMSTPTAGLSVSDALALASSKKKEMDGILIQTLRTVGGGLILSCGKCEICSVCQRAKSPAASCLHPESALLSLDALQIDITRLCQEQFNINLQWGDGQKPPDITTLVWAILTQAPVLFELANAD